MPSHARGHSPQNACIAVLHKRLVAQVRIVDTHALGPYVQPWPVFCPVHFSAWRRLLDPSAPWPLPPETCAIHLWNEQWRRSGQDKDARYDATCLYERLKQCYLR